MAKLYFSYSAMNAGKSTALLVRLDGEGRIIEGGEQIVIGGEDRYVSLCRKHWSRKQLGPAG